MIEIGSHKITVETLDTEDGSTMRRAWPRAAVTELRRNRFEPRIWLRIAGQVVDDVTPVLPEEALASIDAALAEVGLGTR